MLQRLTLSQKIIFPFLFLVSLFAVYDLFLKESATAPPARPDQAQEADYLSQATVFLLDWQKKTATYDFVITRAESRWGRNPFFDRSTLRELSPPAAAKAPTRPKLSYSAFLSIPGKSMAVIDNVEYAINDRLETPGLYLREIYPDHVVVEDLARKQRFKVVIQD